MINTKRYLQLFLLQSFCWGAVFVSPRAFAADSDGSTAPAVAGPTVSVPDSTSTNRPSAAQNRPTSTPKPKSQNVTINLINRLVERGVLSAEDAKDLIQQAETDAAEARTQALKTGTDQATNDTVSVRYVPEIVKAQIRDEIKEDVLKQARTENWIAPNALPSWVSHLRLNGDVRIRYQDMLFPAGNDATGSFPNFNSINTGSPFDTAGGSYPPERNVDQNRNLVRLCVRVGAEIDLESGLTAGIRLATGSDNQPVSANQSLGAAGSAQGGDFSKYAVWLDRGFIKYELGGLPSQDLSFSAGRFDNPFFSTSIIWYDNLAFDGLAVRGRKEVAEGVAPFFSAGAFPVFDTDLNFSSNQPTKYSSEDKWLYAAQVGVDWKINKDLNLKVAGAYYYFYHVEGKLSDPVVLNTSQDQGNTDDRRPSFAQFGNTYFPLRQIIPTAQNGYGTSSQWQYYGLVTPFRDVALTARADYTHFEPFNIALTGEFIKNTAFNLSGINALGPVNNLENGAYAGGDTAWIVGIKVGDLALQKRWDWNIGLDYRYVESDSVVDGFCEPDFGGGGTNVKGYTIRAALALAPKLTLGFNWMCSEEVTGPPLQMNTVWFDITAKF